jgi:hypothetical protein
MYSKLKKKCVRPRIYIINPGYDKQKKPQKYVRKKQNKKKYQIKKMQMSLLCHRSKYSSIYRNCVFLNLKVLRKISRSVSHLLDNFWFHIESHFKYAVNIFFQRTINILYCNVLVKHQVFRYK